MIRLNFQENMVFDKKDHAFVAEEIMPIMKAFLALFAELEKEYTLHYKEFFHILALKKAKQKNRKL